MEINSPLFDRSPINLAFRALGVTGAMVYSLDCGANALFLTERSPIDRND